MSATFCSFLTKNSKNFISISDFCSFSVKDLLIFKSFSDLSPILSEILKQYEQFRAIFRRVFGNKGLEKDKNYEWNLLTLNFFHSKNLEQDRVSGMSSRRRFHRVVSCFCRELSDAIDFTLCIKKIANKYNCFWVIEKRMFLISDPEKINGNPHGNWHLGRHS